MATKSLYILDSLASGSNFHAMQDGGAAPADAFFNPVTGWAPGTTGSGRDAELDSQTEVGAGTFNTTLGPNAPNNTIGNGARTPTALTGTFASGDWTLKLALRANTQTYNGRCRLRWRVWRSSNATGSGATEISSGLGSIISNATTDNIDTPANTVISVMWNPGLLTITDQYLFFTISLEVTSSGGTTGRDANLRLNADTAVLTPDFSAGGAVSSVGMLVA